MDKNDKLKITQNLTRLVASTKMNPELERRLIEYEIFTENMLSGIKIDSLRLVFAKYERVSKLYYYKFFSERNCRCDFV